MFTYMGSGSYLGFFVWEICEIPALDLHFALKQGGNKHEEMAFINLEYAVDYGL